MVGKLRVLASIVTFTVIVSVAVQYSASQAFSDEESKPFQPSANVMADVDDVLVRAKSSGKLALIVMGANWCHDSQGLLAHFKEEEMEAVLERHYERLLVDVGLLDSGADVNRRFGLPVIYGTPTVLIVDPNNERLLNGKDMQQWYNAASIGLDDTVAYFVSKTVPTVRHAAVADDMVNSEVLKKLLSEIDRFEAEQAERIYRGFEIVGPMVAMERHERPKNFYRLWEQLRVLRYKIPDDLVTLRAMARRRVALGETDIELDFPTYPPLEWEVN
ncbi:MAG: hypothetical protein AB3N28_07375 [Kordiimonas sp.]